MERTGSFGSLPARPYPHVHAPTVLVSSPLAFHRSQSSAPPASPPPPTQANQPFSRSYTASVTRSRRAFEVSAATTSAAAAAADGKAPWSSREREWMIGSTAAEVERVATGSTNNRISRAAVVDSLRDATKTLDAAMAASVQSAALSQLQAGDAQGNVSREEVARVWLTNVLPALERAPARDASGSLSTRSLTEKLHRMTHGRLSQVAPPPHPTPPRTTHAPPYAHPKRLPSEWQVMLDELPGAQVRHLPPSPPSTAFDGRPWPCTRPFSDGCVLHPSACSRTPWAWPSTLVEVVSFQPTSSSLWCPPLRRRRCVRLSTSSATRCSLFRGLRG